MKIALLVVSALAIAAGLGIYDAATARDSSGAPSAREFAHLMPSYPGAHYHAASDSMHIAGRSRFLAYAITDDPAERVLARYKEMFEQRGLVVSELPGGLVARASDDDWLRSVVVNGGTIVASVAHEEVAKRSTPLPKPEACYVEESFGARDNGTTRETVSLVCDGFVDDVLDFYDALMSRAAVQDDNAEKTTVRVYESAEGEHMTIVAQQTIDSPPTARLSIYWEAP